MRELRLGMPLPWPKNTHTTSMSQQMVILVNIPGIAANIGPADAHRNT
jgi:hypothetical protein